MADVNTLNRVRSIGGAMGFFDEWNFEIGEGGKLIQQGAQEISQLFTTDILGLGQKEQKPFPPKGSIDFQKETQFKRVFYAKMEETRKDEEHFTLQNSMEETARLEVSAMPSDEKKKLLHVSLDLRNEHISHPYHIHEARRKKMEQIKAAKKQKQSQELASATKTDNLTGRLDAQEGQSMVSQSGAILTAG